jgi:WD40 repeat protein
VNGVDLNRDKTLVATGDDYGLVNIFNYPVVDNQHKARSYAGHSEHVVRALFSDDGQRLYSIGGNDQTLI